ncbi:hypothetical protein ACFJIV_17175 [Mucilaginibacter sp. UC70_90]
MKKKYQYIALLMLLVALASVAQLVSCSGSKAEEANKADSAAVNNMVSVDTTKMPGGKYGAAVRYGRELMLHTAYYIGPEGVNGQYTGNKMNCTNCHRDAGTRPYAFNLVRSFRDYPQYRAREEGFCLWPSASTIV